MNDKLQKLIENIIPFIIIGIAITAFIGLLFMFSYLLFWGLLIGGVLWLISLVTQYVSPKKSEQNKSHRIIEQDNKK